jgi:hypothetical protein
MGFNSMNPKDAMGADNEKLYEMFGEYWFDYAKYASKSTQQFRLHGPVIAYEYYWFNIQTKTKGIKPIPKLCIDLDPYTDEYVSDNCPFRSSGKGRQSRIYIVNGIWRKAQDDKPAKTKPHTAFEKKERVVMAKSPSHPKGWSMFQLAPDSESWTPNYVFKFTAPQTAELNNYQAKHKGKEYDVTDVDYGIDICIKYSKNGQKINYDLSKGEGGEPTPLADEEMDFLVHKLDILTFPTPQQCEKEWKDLRTKIVEGYDRDDDRNSGKGRASASRLDEEDEDNRDTRKGRGRDVDNDDGEEDDAPRGRGRPASSAGKPASSRRGASRSDEPW